MDSVHGLDSVASLRSMRSLGSFGGGSGGGGGGGSPIPGPRYTGMRGDSFHAPSPPGTPTISTAAKVRAAQEAAKEVYQPPLSKLTKEEARAERKRLRKLGLDSATTFNTGYGISKRASKGIHNASMKRLGGGAPVGGGGMEFQPGDSNGVYVFLSDGPMGDSQRRPLGKHGWQHEVQSRTGSSPSPRLDDDGLPPADPSSDNTDHRQAPSWRPNTGGSSRQLQHGSSRGGHRGGVPPPSLDVRPLSAGDVLAGSGGSTSGEAANRP